jgi:hypothetical protein
MESWLFAGLIIAVVLLLALWLRNRNAIRAYFAVPLEPQRLDAPPWPAGGEALATGERLEGLGYAPAGWIRLDPTENRYSAVYAHTELPAYAIAAIEGRENRVSMLHLDSFFEGGGRLITTNSPLSGRLSAAVNLGAPRLVQLRPGGTPTALDGQHMGTLKAWMAGGRQPLPADAEAYVVHLAADLQRLKEKLRASGWLPPGVFLGWLIGRPKGILRF